MQREAHVGRAERTGNGGAGLTGEAQGLALSAFGAGGRQTASGSDAELGESGLALGQSRGKQLELIRGLDDAAGTLPSPRALLADGHIKGQNLICGVHGWE